MDASSLVAFHEPAAPKRIVIFFEHGADIVNELANFKNDLDASKIPVTIIIEERLSQWSVLPHGQAHELQLSEFKIEDLSRDEISRILEKLREHDCLGKLDGTSVDYQEEHFLSLSKQDLLVSLRELASNSTFDEIVKDEFNQVTSPNARDALVIVSAIGQLDLPIRHGVLCRVVGVSHSDIGEKIIKPTEGILFTVEDTGYSRHNFGYRLESVSYTHLRAPRDS